MDPSANPSGKPSVAGLLDSIAAAGKAFERREPEARMKIIDLALSLIAELESPVEFVRRIGVSEVGGRSSFRVRIESASY
jgi:hypothetical protein